MGGIEAECIDCSPELQQTIELSLARFQEELEALVFEYLKTANPELLVLFPDEEEAQ
jgi:hypothetical protein